MKANLIKKTALWFLIVLLTLSMSACGSNGGATNPTKNPSNLDNGDGIGTSQSKNNINYDFLDTTIGANGKDYANYDPYANASKYNGKTVKFATWIDHQSTEGKEPIESFSKKYGIDVQLVYCSQNNYIEEIMALIAAGNAPDVFVENATFPAILQIAQPFSVTGVDLNEPIWAQPILNACTVGNKVYAVNTVNSVWRGEGIVVYNRELMESNGIKTPSEYYDEGNWTFDTLEKVINDVKSLGSDFTGSDVDKFMITGSLGGDQVSYDYKNAKFTNTLTSQEYIEGMQYLAKLEKNNLNGSQQSFINGKSALCITGCYGIKKTGYFRTMDFLELGVTYLPSKDKNSKAIPTEQLRAYGIVRGSKNPEAAGMFIRYFLDPANYDLEKTFVSKEAAKFYFEMMKNVYDYSKNADIKIQYQGLASLIGESAWSWVSVSGDSSQIPMLLQQKKNLVDSAISKSDELLAKMK